MRDCLKTEIKQSKPFSSLEEEVFISLQRTADVLTAKAEAVLKQYGISVTQFNVLRILRGAGGAGLACGEIGERMIARDPDITRLLDRLERSGWIARTRDDKDRRVVITRITREGLGLLAKLDRPVQEFNVQALGHMGEKRMRALLNGLNEARHPPTT
ncbi:MAG TPA: MarR family transcriptional regulator [Clostridia bacterium]|nr:MarR family transcriptional regulator [Clostridia bacterium]